jgi:hypothetical protein
MFLSRLFGKKQKPPVPPVEEMRRQVEELYKSGRGREGSALLDKLLFNYSSHDISWFNSVADEYEEKYGESANSFPITHQE